MSRRSVLLAGIAALVLVAALAVAVIPRVRARARADWLEQKNLTLAPAVKGLRQPTFVAGPPDGSNRLFVLERDGVVRVANSDGTLRPDPFLDISADVSTREEQGLLGLAFHPQFDRNRYVYISYTDNQRALHVVRYTAGTDPHIVADTASAQSVLNLPKQSVVHNGGMLAFGPDGYLYVSVGDDEHGEYAQSLDTVFGKILRLDVDSAEPYAIPSTNPFANVEGARGEIWAYGFRNPWRFSFDRETGDMWIGDVGEAKWEEVDVLPAGSGGGENYGWPMNEATECLDASHCHDPGLVEPVATFGHDMTCAVTGGYVYRGKQARSLVGAYLFGDLCTGGVFAVRAVGDHGPRIELAFNPLKVSSFGEDPSGDVYVVDLQGGVVYRVVDGSLDKS
jgi:glucose/arabinose dehydrogenase